jgi:hypothetical protein
MTYATAIARGNLATRKIVKFEGIPAYFADFAGQYNDGGSHGNRYVKQTLLDFSPSGGRIDYTARRVTSSTVSVSIQDDAEVRAWFSRRSAFVTTTNNVATGATSIEVSNSAGFASGDYAWLGPECIIVGGVSSGTLTGCTRHVLGTKATQHPIGVKCQNVGSNKLHGLKAWISTGVLDGDQWVYTEPYLTCVVDGSPTFENGVWSINLMSGIDNLDRKFVVGQSRANVAKFEKPSVSADWKVYLDNMLSILDAGANQEAALWLDVKEQDNDGRAAYGVAAFKIETIGSNYVTIKGNSTSLLDAGQTFAQYIAGAGAEVAHNFVAFRHFASDAEAFVVYPQTGDCGDPNPSYTALRVLLSDLGDGTNSAKYDVLPGKKPTSTEPLVRYGAGLTADDVDIAAFEGLAYTVPTVVPYIVGAESNLSIVDWLCKEIAPLLGGYIYYTSDGKLSIRRYEPATISTASSATLDDSTGDNAVDDESTAVSAIHIKTHWDYKRGKYMRDHNAFYPMQNHLYGDDGATLETESVIGSLSQFEAIALFKGFVERWGNGSKRYNVVESWRYHLLRPADTVLYSNPRIPNHNGGLGVVNQVCEVVAVQPNFDAGTVDIELVARPTAKIIAPSGFLSYVYSGSYYVISPYYSDYTDDEDWAVGWAVDFYNPLTGEKRNSATITIATISDPYMTFTGDMTGVVVNDIMLLAASSSAAVNTAVGAAATDYVRINSGNWG